MEIKKYREYLHSRNVPGDKTEKILALIGDFIQFFTDCGSKETAKTAGKVEVARYARKLIAEGRNTLENFSILRDYAVWLGNRKLYVALIEVMDCHNALEVLAAEVEKRYGRKTGSWKTLRLIPLTSS